MSRRPGRAHRARALLVCVGAAAVGLATSCEPAGDGGAVARAGLTPVCARDSLGAQLDSISLASGGELSLSFVDVRSGERFGRRGMAPVFMSSVMKLPLAVQLLARVDAGELRLTDSVEVEREQLSLGRSPLSMRFPDGFTMRVDSLLVYALSESDNTAADALLRYSGGPRRASAELQRLGVSGIRLDRNYLRYGWDLFGGEPLPAEAPLTKSMVDSVRALAIAADDATHDSLSRAFATQPEDRASTDALADLLARLARGELLSDRSRALLLRAMTRSNNPDTRIVAGLPDDARVAHKTGTWSDFDDVYTSLSDVGIVTLGDGREIALAIMVANADADEPAIDAAIADATRAVLADLERCSVG